MLGDLLRARVAALAAAALFIRYWPAQGSRREAAKALGGFLSRVGWTVDDITCITETVIVAAGDDEREDRIRAAEDAARAHRSGGRAYGIPKLDELFGKGIGGAVAGWLGYKPEKSQTEKPTAEPVIRTARELGGREFSEIRYVVEGVTGSVTGHREPVTVQARGCHDARRAEGRDARRARSARGAAGQGRADDRHDPARAGRDGRDDSAAG